MNDNLNKAAYWLVIIGALNVGLVGVGGWDVLDMLLGGMGWLARLVNVLIGLSAVLMLMDKK